MQIQGDGHTLLIPDEELASLRSVEKLEVICEEVLPKRLSDIRRLTAELTQRRQPLSWQDFERTVLTLVYTTQTLARITNKHQKEIWTDTLIQLFQALQKDLKPFWGKKLSIFFSVVEMPFIHAISSVLQSLKTN